MSRQLNRAFTIVEIVVVITIVAILSSLAVMTFSSVREESRDASRQGNATIISEALEKYYEKNGEYPSVASISNTQASNTGDVVAGRLSVPASSLIMPDMPKTTTNGITAGTAPTNNYLAYEAESDSDPTGCQSSPTGGCDRYVLRYIAESNGEVQAIESRRSSRPSVVAPDLVVTGASSTSINASWSATSGVVSYTLQRSVSADMSSPVTTSHTTTTTVASGLAPDTEYFFRVRSNLPTGSTEWSSVESATTSSVLAPTGTITITAAMSGTDARGTAGGGVCASGSTLERQIRYLTNSGAWQTWTTGTPRDVAATEGYRYTFQAQARCVISGTPSSWVQSATAAVTRPVTAPTGLTISAGMSGTNARGTAGGGTCAAGTTIERQIRYAPSGTTSVGTYVAYTTGTPRDVPATQGWRYTFQQQARCVGTNASSGWAASGTAFVIRPIATPAAPGLSVATSGSTTTWTATSVCPAGTTARYERMSQLEGSAWSAWEGSTTSNISTWITSAEGYTYSRKYHVLCENTNTSSPWSAESPVRSYYRPMTVAPPSGWTHVSLGWQQVSNCKYYMSGCKWRRFNWNPPTCGAGTVYAGSSWNSYVGAKMSWDNGQGQAYRWWYGYSQSDTTTDAIAYPSAVNSHIIEYSSNVPPSYDYVMHKVIYTCRNTATGRTITQEYYSPKFLYM